MLDEQGLSDNLYPFAQTRSIADIRIGILTIREKWELIFGMKIEAANSTTDASEEVIKIPANRVPLFNKSPEFPSALIVENSFPINEVSDLYKLNDKAIRHDFLFVTRGRESNPISSSNTLIRKEDIFLEEGVNMENVSLNASTGPIYIGKNVTIMEGSMLRGPLAICEGAVVKMGAKIYGATTVGPYCMVGGEIKNSILFGYSNKAHDGYLGDSVIGEWCNLGAGTSNSNLKNTAGDVNLWNNKLKTWSNAGNRCGLFMGDYSRAAINTSFNTGTVTGICCNIFNEYFPPKYIPDFTWGKERYVLEKVFRDINNWKQLKGHSLGEEEKKIIADIYKSTEKI